jgi:hypothetical protein
MKYSKYIIILFAFFLSAIEAQGKEIVIKGRLIDFDTGEPIIASYVIYDLTEGFSHSNEKGEFELKALWSFHQDSIIITSMEYYRVVIKGIRFRETIDLGDIYLKSSVIPIYVCRFGRIYNPIKYLIIRCREKRHDRKVKRDKKRQMERSKNLTFEFENQIFRVDFIADKFMPYYLIDLSKPIN